MSEVTEAPAASAEIPRMKRPHPRPRTNKNQDKKESFSYSNLNKKNKELRKEIFTKWDVVNRKIHNEESINENDTESLFVQTFGEPAVAYAELKNRMHTAAGSRAVQSIIKHGTEGQKARVCRMLLDIYDEAPRTLFEDMALNIYGHQSCISLIRYCEGGFDRMIQLLKDLGQKLFCSTKGSRLWEFAYKTLKSTKPVDTEAVQSFLNSFILPPKIIALIPDARKKTIEVMLEDTEHKQQIMNNFEKIIHKMIGKKVFRPLGLALVTKYYLDNCETSDIEKLAKRLLVNDSLKDAGELQEVLGLTYSFLGVEVLSTLMGYVDAKDRRNLITIMKNTETTKKLYTTEFPDFSWLFIVRIMMILDDTKQCGDMLKNAGAICRHEARAGDSLIHCEDCPMYKLILGKDLNLKKGENVAFRGRSTIIKALTMETNTFWSNQQWQSLVNLASPKSKKEMSQRAKEVRGVVGNEMCKFILRHIELEDKEVVEAITKGDLRDIVSVLLHMTDLDKHSELMETVLALYANKEVVFSGRNKVLKSLAKCNVLTEEAWNTLFNARLSTFIKSDAIYCLLDFLKTCDNKEYNKKTLKKVSKIEGFGSVKKGEKLLLEYIKKD